MIRYVSLLLTSTLLAYASPTNAGWPCSIDHAYPEVSALSIDDGKLVAILGTHFFNRKEKIEISGQTHEVFVQEFPRLVMLTNGEWKNVGVVNLPKTWAEQGEQCIQAPRDPDSAWRSIHPDTPLERAQGDWFDQSVMSCASDGQYNWGGISFYGAEGGWGVGGLVKQHIETGEIEYIRPRKLVGASTGPLAYFAGELWFGHTWFGECAGPPSGTGLKRLTFHQYLKRYEVEEVPEVCGFAIRDFQEFDGALWIATELGLSRLIEDNGLHWTNYVPDLADPSLMREVECDALYAELLSSKKFAETEGFDIGNAFDAFWERLSELRPGFVRRYLRELHGLNSE